MSDSYGTPEVPARRAAGLDAHDDARALVRLIQCCQCSRPLTVPVTLPCGHSVCRTCLPDPHRRANIVYTNTPDRIQGTICPVEGCGQEHAVGDCNVDVYLLKVMESITVTLASTVAESVSDEKDVLHLVEVLGASLADVPTFDIQHSPRRFQSQGGQLRAIYDMAAAGCLDYRADVAFEQLIVQEDSKTRRADVALLEQIREATHRELDCQVCYNLMFDPVTAPCGHSFCRICLTRVLDHSMQCPMCRRNLPIPPSLTRQSSNLRLVSLLQALCPEMVASRGAAISAEEQGGLGELDTPLFVCTLAFPGQPTFLHIFEPRYRLMIRRAYDANRQFGMMMYNQTGEVQGELGSVNFKQYGTMLQILNIHMFPDGRSLIETRGMYRFRVLAHGTLDGYTVGRVQRVEDVGLVEEERLEAEEIAVTAPVALPTTEINAQPASPIPSPPPDADVQSLTTRQLLTISLEFIQRMRAHSAPWLHQRILQSHGGPPDDAATFPFWFAAIIPIMDEEKYQLLRTSTIRERLKIVVGWIRRIESQRL